MSDQQLKTLSISSESSSNTLPEPNISSPQPLIPIVKIKVYLSFFADPQKESVLCIECLFMMIDYVKCIIFIIIAYIAH